jgi:hypothetical protein
MFMPTFVPIASFIPGLYFISRPAFQIVDR